MRLTVFFLFAFASLSFGQKEANVWHFGNGYSYDFNSGTATLNATQSAMFTSEGSTSYCDEFGNLLFYSNGGGRVPASGQDPGHIWNRNHDVMYDMQGLEGGGFSAVQSSVIVPAPGEPNMYYLFTMEELEHYVDATPQILAQEPNGRGFRYFKIDMTLNNGLGDVIEADVPIYNYSFEALCAIRHANKQDYWLLIYQDTTGIGVYSLTQNGISLSAVYPTGAPVNGGTIKSSPSSANPGAVCCQKVMTSQGLFDFDLTTGVLSNQTGLSINNETAYEFSPNGLYLYSSLTNQSNGQQQLIRYDLLDAFETGANVESTMEVIDPAVATSLYYMQLAPDGKIYFNHFDYPNGFTKLGTIDCPNGSSPTVNYDVLSVGISSEDAFFALPNYPSWIFYSSFDQYINLGPDTVKLCQGDTLILNAGAGTSWNWFGQLESGNTYTSTNQLATITQPGNYTASVSGACGMGSDQIVVLPCETTSTCDALDLGDPINACLNDTIELNADLSSFQSIEGLEWSGGGTFLPSNSVPNPLYIPTQSEYNAGSATVTLNVSLPAPSSVPQGLLAYDHTGEDLLFYISTLNGSIDSIQENTGKDWTAMGFRSADCLLYGLSNIVTSPMLSSVDPVSGAVLDIFSYENHQFYAGEYDNENDLFYAVGIPEINSGSLSDQLLYTINPVTGALDTIGNLNLTAIDGFFYTPDNGINGLAFNPDLDVLYGITDNGKLYQINPSNAAISLIGNTISGMRGLAYDEIEDKLWAISPSATLVEIDKLTGAQLGSVLCEETFGNVTSLTFVSGTCGENTTCNDALLIEFSDCNQPEPEEDSIPEIQAPNVFTPGNGDEVNDLYFLNTKNIHYLQLTIYNRWGNILFKEESNDLINDNPSWDGGAAPEGVYFYCYEAKGNNGQIIEGKGFLHLLR